MPATKAKPRNSAKRNRAPRAVMSPSDVLTLSEAAAYLRVSEAAVLRSAGPGGLPGRLVGGE